MMIWGLGVGDGEFPKDISLVAVVNILINYIRKDVRDVCLHLLQNQQHSLNLPPEVFKSLQVVHFVETLLELSYQNFSIG